MGLQEPITGDQAQLTRLLGVISTLIDKIQVDSVLYIHLNYEINTRFVLYVHIKNNLYKVLAISIMSGH